MILRGKIIKLSSKKTVSIVSKKKIYKKKYKTFFYKDRKYLIHFNCLYLKLGMEVLFTYYKKISKKKSWKILKILK
ncbi:30S ribosomal protein S17 [Candidatus Vidania fulgoroideorum]